MLVGANRSVPLRLPLPLKLRMSVSFLLYTLTSAAYAVTASTPAVLDRLNGADVVASIASFDRILDTRPNSSCQRASVQNATCAPMEDFLAPRRRLANWSGIYWLLGSLDLSGTEHVLVIGEKSSRRDFLAALLLLAGQQRISVLQQPVSAWLANLAAPNAGQHGAIQGPGRQRSSTRTTVYSAVMRSDTIVLRDELHTLVMDNAIVLDGRSEAQYYGAARQVSRAGHIPGAQHSPMVLWNSDPARAAAPLVGTRPIAYAHDAIEGLIYLTALHVAGIPARLYLAGWAEWASDGTLPIDNATYPSVSPSELAPARLALKAQPVEQAEQVTNSFISSVARWWMVVLFLSLLVALLGFQSGRLSVRKSV